MGTPRRIWRIVTGRQRLTADALDKVNRLTPSGRFVAVRGREMEGKWHAVLLDSTGDGLA